MNDHDDEKSTSLIISEDVFNSFKDLMQELLKSKGFQEQVFSNVVDCVLDVIGDQMKADYKCNIVIEKVDITL